MSLEIEHDEYKPGTVRRAAAHAGVAASIARARSLSSARCVIPVFWRRLSKLRIAIVALNEPETSLHPDLLEPLAKQLVNAAKYSQLCVVTHRSALAELVVVILRREVLISPADYPRRRMCARAREWWEVRRGSG